ncbi:EXPH5 protein, partial [Crypturellus undulatus]|nr:EXPH5 protein [Crypturellus undulatus]
QAETYNSPTSAEPTCHSFNANQDELMENTLQEWNEQLEKEFFRVLDDLDDQLAQEQAQDPLDKAVPPNSANVQPSKAFGASERPATVRGQRRAAWSDLPSAFFPDGLRTIRAKEEHKIFIRPRKLQKGSLYPPSITQNSGFRHKYYMNRDTAGRSYSVCSLRRCSSSASSEQLSASALQHPLARESNDGFIPRFGRQNPKRTPLSSIVWNNTPDSAAQTSPQEKMFRTQSLLEFHATDHGRYPSPLQEGRKYACYHSKHHYRRSLSSSNCFSRVSCPDKAASPLSFDNWENYPLYNSENNLSGSCYRDTSSHGKLYINQKNSPYGKKDNYPFWADIPPYHSDAVFVSPDASFEVVMANLNDRQWTHTKNAKECNRQFTSCLQNESSGNIYTHNFGDPKTSEHGLNHFCLEKENGNLRNNSPCIERPNKQDSSLRYTSSCSITGSPSRNNSKSSDPLVIYYTLPRKSASIAGSVMSDTAISFPRESRRSTQEQDTELPLPKANSQSPRIHKKKNEGRVSLANVFFPNTLEKEVPSYSSDQESSALVAPQNLETAADSKDRSSPLPPSSEAGCLSRRATKADTLDAERQASSSGCSPPLPLLTDKNSNPFINSYPQSDLGPEQSLTSQVVFGQQQNESNSLKNANLRSDQLRKSHTKAARERHLSERTCVSRGRTASGSSPLPRDGRQGRRFKSYSELLSCDENENWASDDVRTCSARNLMYPSVEFGIFGKEQQLAFLENIKRSLTEGRLWRPCLLNNPGSLRDGESPSLSRPELWSSSSAGSKMSSAASSPRESTEICRGEAATYSDSDTDTTTDDEYYLDEGDKESEL